MRAQRAHIQNAARQKELDAAITVDRQHKAGRMEYANALGRK